MPHGGREEKNNDLTVSRESTSERVAASCAAAIDWGGMASPETHRHLWLLSNSSCLCNFARYLSISINTPVVRLSKFCVPAPSFRSTGGGGASNFSAEPFFSFSSLTFLFPFSSKGKQIWTNFCLPPEEKFFGTFSATLCGRVESRRREQNSKTILLVSLTCHEEN